MRSTLIDIARAAGVSAATVDRVLNNRAGVRSRTREIVLETAQRLGYISAGSGKLPDAVDPVVRLDFVIPLGTNTFMKMLRHQLEKQGTRPGLDVRVHTIEGPNPDTLANVLHDLRSDTQGVGVIALDHPTVREAIRRLAANGVKILTLASDITHVPRVAYVGIDNRQAGRLAGFVLGRFLGKTGPKKVAMFAGSLSYRGHEEREMGFRHVLAEDFPNLTVVELREILEDRAKAYSEALALLDRYEDLAGIYNIGSGNQGIARALQERGRERSVVFIGHEATDATRQFLLTGTMDAVIDQNPRIEAREALVILMNAIRDVPYEPHLPRLQIIFKENIPES